MSFSITVLMENTAAWEGLAAEHGLSLLVEGPDCRVLYDTGASPRFWNNARSMGVSLSPLDALVLSHGHYDHTGGTAALLGEGVRPGRILLGPEFFTARYAQKGSGLAEIGAAVSRRLLETSKIPLEVVGEDPLELGRGVWAVSGFPCLEEPERPNPRLLRRRGGALEVDPFPDEAALMLEAGEDLALLSGCAHSGVVSMCRQVSARFGRPVTVFLGGTHLSDSGEERVRYTCARLRELGVRRLGACHCTGAGAMEYFAARFPGFFPVRTGLRISLPEGTVEMAAGPV